MYCVVLYCNVLYWIKSNWTVLYRNVLNYIIFYCTVLYCIELDFIELNWIVSELIWFDLISLDSNYHHPNKWGYLRLLFITLWNSFFFIIMWYAYRFYCDLWILLRWKSSQNKESPAHGIFKIMRHNIILLPQYLFSPFLYFLFSFFPSRFYRFFFIFIFFF